MNKITIYSLSILFTLTIGCKENSKKETNKLEYLHVLPKQTENKDSLKKVKITEGQNDFCDINLINEIFNNTENIEQKKIETFLLSFNLNCKNNVEYSQYRNEVLFNLLNKRTTQVINLISENKKLNKLEILKNIENPISDLIPLDSIIRKIEKQKSSSIKKELLSAIIKAKN